MLTANVKHLAAARSGSASGRTAAFLAIWLVLGTSGCIDEKALSESVLWGRSERAFDALPGRPAPAKEAAPDPEPYTEKIPGTVVTFEMIPVPGGSIRTSEGEATEVEPMWFGKTEVTWDAYDVYVYELDKQSGLADVDAVSRPSKPYVLPGESFGHQGNPALAMTFKAASEYARWLSARTGKTYRLPTEAEWEHACRLGREETEDLSEHAWYWDNASDQAHKVGTLEPNALGLHDVLGNVAEWAMAADGTPVIKGGSWYDAAEDVGCEARKTQTPAWNVTDPQLPKSEWWLSDAPFVGFRLVRELGSESGGE